MTDCPCPGHHEAGVHHTEPCCDEPHADEWDDTWTRGDGVQRWSPDMEEGSRT